MDEELAHAVEVIREVLQNLENHQNEELHLSVELGYHFLEELTMHVEE